MTTKVCNRCKTPQDISSFHTNGRTDATGQPYRDPACRTCRKAYRIAKEELRAAEKLAWYEKVGLVHSDVVQQRIEMKRRQWHISRGLIVPKIDGRSRRARQAKARAKYIESKLNDIENHSQLTASSLSNV